MTWHHIDTGFLEFRYKKTPVSCNMTRINWVLIKERNRKCGDLNIYGSFLIREGCLVKFIRNRGVSKYSTALIRNLQIKPMIRARSLESLRTKYGVSNSVEIPISCAHPFCRTYKILQNIVGDEVDSIHQHISKMLYLPKLDESHIRIFITNLGLQTFVHLALIMGKTSSFYMGLFARLVLSNIDIEHIKNADNKDVVGLIYSTTLAQGW